MGKSENFWTIYQVLLWECLKDVDAFGRLHRPRISRKTDWKYSLMESFQNFCSIGEIQISGVRFIQNFLGL